MQGDLQALFFFVQRVFGFLAGLHETHAVQRHGHMARDGLHEFNLPVRRWAHAFGITISAHTQSAQALLRQEQGHIDDGAVMQLGHDRFVGARIGTRVFHNDYMVRGHDLLHHRVAGDWDVHRLHQARCGGLNTRRHVADYRADSWFFSEQRQPAVAIPQLLLNHGRYGAENVRQIPGPLQPFAQMQQGLGA